ncbi:MAG: DUF1800 family protein [Candidatus Baltobacteraceae bacterium]
MATAQISQTDVAGINRPAGILDAGGALAPFQGAWSARLAAHLLRRAGFGGTQDEIARLAAMPVSGAVESLVNFPDTRTLPQPDDVYDPRQDLQNDLPRTMRAFMGSPGARQELLKQIRKRERESVISLQNWWLNRMLTTPAPLQEKMALYFHGHFTTAAIQKGVTPVMTFEQNQLFRNAALGNLRGLTQQVSVGPAMLLYLDNAKSDPEHPNENYARELMELFTLGVDHYSEDDVRASARAWTGWAVIRRTGEARYNEARHDGGSKTFLGRTGNWTGKDIVDIIYDQPACAEFWANSLLNFFVYNDPEPQLVRAVAHTIRKNDFNLKPVVSTLLRSNVFFSDRAYRALVKSPVEFVVGTYKTLGVSPIDVRAQQALNQMGQILFYPPNVAGWPGGVNWLTSQTMIVRQNFVASLVNSPLMQNAGWMTQVPVNAPQAAANLVRRILSGDASGAGVAQLVDYLNGTDTSALGKLSGENYDERVRGAAYLTMAMPAYQLN